MKNLKLNLLEKKEMNEVRGGQFDPAGVWVAGKLVQCKCHCVLVDQEHGKRNGEDAKQFALKSEEVKAMNEEMAKTPDTIHTY